MSLFHDVAEVRRLVPASTGAGLFLAMTGLLVWAGLSVFGGASAEDGLRLREAWDTPAYFYIGVPVMAAAVAFVSFRMPSRVWRWPLWLVGGHQLGVLLIGLGMQSGFSLVLLTLILGALLAVFFTVPALAGSLVADRLRDRRWN